MISAREELDSKSEDVTIGEFATQGVPVPPRGSSLQEPQLKFFHNHHCNMPSYDSRHRLVLYGLLHIGASRMTQRLRGKEFWEIRIEQHNNIISLYIWDNK